MLLGVVGGHQLAAVELGVRAVPAERAAVPGGTQVGQVAGPTSSTSACGGTTSAPDAPWSPTASGHAAAGWVKTPCERVGPRFGWFAGWVLAPRHNKTPGRGVAARSGGQAVRWIRTPWRPRAANKPPLLGYSPSVSLQAWQRGKTRCRALAAARTKVSWPPKGPFDLGRLAILDS